MRGERQRGPWSPGSICHLTVPPPCGTQGPAPHLPDRRPRSLAVPVFPTFHPPACVLRVGAAGGCVLAPRKVPVCPSAAEGPPVPPRLQPLPVARGLQVASPAFLASSTPDRLLPRVPRHLQRSERKPRSHLLLQPHAEQLPPLVTLALGQRQASPRRLAEA